jgi:SAM-dependent methyltransferase
MKRFTSDDYGEGYWERAEGSNYRNYGDDAGWHGILHVMNQFLGAGIRLTEAACSKGYFVHHARRNGYEARGFDLSEYAIRKSVAPLFTVVHDATKPWPYNKASADAVCGWEFLEHIPEDQMGGVISEAIRVLKPGGTLWFKTGIVVPDSHDFAGQDDHDHTHVNMQPREYWEYQFSTYGLEHVPEIEAALDDEFRDRDWKGRFFVWEKPA